MKLSRVTIERNRHYADYVAMIDRSPEGKARIWDSEAKEADDLAADALNEREKNDHRLLAEVYRHQAQAIRDAAKATGRRQT
jgi:Lhr-like helicase